MAQNEVGILTGTIRHLRASSKDEIKEVEGVWEVCVYYDDLDKPHKVGGHVIGYAQRIK